jgi:DNA-binding CsgD family transcriptional regulator
MRVLQWDGLVFVSIANMRTDAEGEVKPDDIRSPALELSLRQREVLQLLAEGLTTKEIAIKLGLHQRTIAVHIAELKERLGTQTRAQTVGRGAVMGLCEPGTLSSGHGLSGLWE